MHPVSSVCATAGLVRHVGLHPLPEPDHPREVGWRKDLLLDDFFVQVLITIAFAPERGKRFCTLAGFVE